MLKQNAPWIFSILLHLISIALLFSFNNKLNEASHGITVNIISSLKNENSGKLEKKKVKKLPEIGEMEEDVAQKNHAKEKKSPLDSEKIEDISYSKNIYEIGSKQNPAPVYPRIARLRNYQGEVKIGVIVDFEGRVIEAQIRSSSGYPALDESALQTVKNWHFDVGGSSLGQKKRYRIIVPITFVLR